jgi:GDP-4-dehydro-6-deoxy-D-mannose reductase
MRVWVSGARGFVGSQLVPRLVREGCDVVATGREVDVTDADSVDASIAAARPDALVHLAGRASVAESFGAPEATARVNYAGALHVLRAAARHAPRARVLLVSSSEVYGESAEPVPIAESAPLAPASPYARAKVAADLAAAAAAARGQDVVRARPFNHTGPGQSVTYVAPSFARQLAEIEAGRREPLLRVGNLDAVRDFLDVADVVEAYVRLLDPGVPADAYNVGSGVGRPIGALLDGLLAHTRVRPAIEVDRARWRPAGALIGDATRLRKATGWRPVFALDDTLARLLDFWRAQVSASP